MQTNTLAQLLTRTGCSGALLQSHHWAETGLGPPESWPQSLQTALSICLTSSLPMFIVWGDELALFYNEACQQVLDLPAHAPGSGQPVKLGCPQLWAAVGSLLRQIMQAEEVQAEQPYRWRSADGTQAHALTFASSPILSEVGEVGGVFTVVMSLSAAIKQAEREVILPELTFERAQFEAVQQQMPTGVVIAEAESGRLLANPQDTSILDTEAELRQQRVENALRRNNTTLGLLSEVANQLLLNEQPKAFIDLLYTRLSEHLGLELYFNYLFDEAQQQLYLHAHGGIPSQVAERLHWLKLGQTVSGTVALHRQCLVVEDTQQTTDPITEQIRALGVTAYACYPLLSREKFIGTLSFGTRTRSHFEPDELALMQTVCDQVAAALERSQLLTQLQQRAAELTHANRIKDEFMAVLSHELRSPLNPILGWATLLRRRLKDPLLEQAAETIERNVRLQVQLIDDLLDISRILRGKLSLNREAVRLEEIVAAALETVHLAATAKAISIHTHLAPDVGWVLGDPARLQQVVWNLLSNAVKFTPKGGQVEVGLSLVAGQSHLEPCQDSLVQLTVSDTGKGISAGFLPHVFESFRQEDGTTTRQFGGLGLGLAIVRHIVEMHGGTISAASPGEGQGATFTVSLPHFQPYGNVPSPQAPALINFEDEPLQGCRILLVEDDFDSRTFLTILLEQAGAEVSAIASAPVALARFPDSQPHILISDIGMPELDGYQLIQQIRSLPPERGGAVPAIALTAYASESDTERAISAGFQRHIAKPVDPSDLVKAILDLMPSNSNAPAYRNLP
ncbi:MAG: response regulator [Cyanobacteria bacterium Co-bin13]|nr:response regulator [Cyanobacteria bacterium Co-bin13]